MGTSSTYRSCCQSVAVWCMGSVTILIWCHVAFVDREFSNLLIPSAHNNQLDAQPSGSAGALANCSETTNGLSISSNDSSHENQTDKWSSSDYKGTESVGISEAIASVNREGVISSRLVQALGNEQRRAPLANAEESRQSTFHEIHHLSNGSESR